MTKKKPKARTVKVWVLVDTTGYIYAPTVEYLRKDCLKIPHERGVQCLPATLTLSPKKRRTG